MPIYVQHEVLGRIPDVFNAEAIWQAPGLALISRRPLLRDLLERSPREHKGRAATRCFSHVTLMLPQEEVDDDYHLTRGAKARDLAQTLTALHQKDFGDLLGADQVRYDVVGTEALAPGQIEVKFGHAVYLPAADEKILYNVSVSRDSAIWQPVCLIYPNQRLALVGGDPANASFVAQAWPFGAEGAVLIINDGPDAPPIVQMRPKEFFDCRYDARGGYYTIKSTRGGIDELGGSPRLLLKVTRVGPPPQAMRSATPIALSARQPAVAGAAMPAMPAMAPTLAATVPAMAAAKPAVWQSRSGAAAADHRPHQPRGKTRHQRQHGAIDQTAVPISHQPSNQAGESDATYAPISQQRVSLVALALPRLSRYRDTGAAALELPFNSALALCADGDADQAIRFTVNAADELYASTAAGRQRITAPASFAPVDARAIALLAVPAAMAERYCATLCLAQPVAVAVASGARFTFGRSSAMLAALRVLDSPRFLQPGAHLAADAGAASADRIGLSRKAFSFEASPQGFKIGRLAATQALYHLDERMEFVAAIGEAGADAPYLLPAGHHLVAGHYVLRFDA
ncbi:hypothetical protein [Rugamonas sp.]|uniref:hypothetical protein n=1 Tax=Rugamonas sp. TaxID=1926287 RepID=UPI0025D1FEF3|nr:hypothetical protein [Rugamonas sp.]